MQKQKELSLTEHNDQIGELWNADPNCRHEIEYPIGGGVVCKKCGGWFCY